MTLICPDDLIALSTSQSPPVGVGVRRHCDLRVRRYFTLSIEGEGWGEGEKPGISPKPWANHSLASN